MPPPPPPLFVHLFFGSRRRRHSLSLSLSLCLCCVVCARVENERFTLALELHGTPALLALDTRRNKAKCCFFGAETCTTRLFTCFCFDDRKTHRGVPQLIVIYTLSLTLSWNSHSWKNTMQPAALYYHPTLSGLDWMNSRFTVDHHHGHKSRSRNYLLMACRRRDRM